MMPSCEQPIFLSLWENISRSKLRKEGLFWLTFSDDHGGEGRSPMCIAAPACVSRIVIQAGCIMVDQKAERVGVAEIRGRYNLQCPLLIELLPTARLHLVNAPQHHQLGNKGSEHQPVGIISHPVCKEWWIWAVNTRRSMLGMYSPSCAWTNEMDLSVAWCLESNTNLTPHYPVA